MNELWFYSTYGAELKSNFGRVPQAWLIYNLPSVRALISFVDFIFIHLFMFGYF